MSAAVERQDRLVAAVATRRRRQSGALTHAILLLGVLAVVFPIWIAVVGSTHDASTIGRGDVPLLPGALGVALGVLWALCLWPAAIGWLIATVFLLMPGRMRLRQRTGDPTSAILLHDRAADAAGKR